MYSVQQPPECRGDLIPNIRLRKKVGAFKNKDKEENRIQLQPLPKLLLLHKQKVAEKKIIKDQKPVEAVVSNITDQETPSDNVPVSSEMMEDSDEIENPNTNDDGKMPFQGPSP